MGWCDPRARLGRKGERRVRMGAAHQQCQAALRPALPNRLSLRRPGPSCLEPTATRVEGFRSGQAPVEAVSGGASKPMVPVNAGQT